MVLSNHKEVYPDFKTLFWLTPISWWNTGEFQESNSINSLVRVSPWAESRGLDHDQGTKRPTKGFLCAWITISFAMRSLPYVDSLLAFNLFSFYELGEITRRLLYWNLRMRGLEGPLFSRPSFIVIVRRVLAHSVRMFPLSDGSRGSRNRMRSTNTRRRTLSHPYMSTSWLSVSASSHPCRNSSQDVRHSLVHVLSLVKSSNILQIPLNCS